MTAPRPFLKWAGGKRALATDILRLLPPAASAGRYFEPFVGAGAVFFAYGSEFAHLNDVNPELMRTYKAVRDDVEAVIGRLRDHRDHHSEGHFYDVRAWSPEALTDVETAARMIYLNRTCFNGLYRVSKKSGFNVPFGDYAKAPQFDEDNLRKAATRLEYATFSSLDFAAFLTEPASAPVAGDVVYLDPPYVPISKTSSFTGFVKGGFSEMDQRRLATLFHVLADRGVHVVASNSAAPLVRELYDMPSSETGSRPRFYDISRKGSISSKGTERTRVRELLIEGGGNERRETGGHGC